MDENVGQKVPLRLKFLTDDQSLCNLATRYWDAYFGPGATLLYPETVGTLCELFGLTQKELLQKLPEIVHVSYRECPGCHRGFMVLNRNELQQVENLANPICTDCGRREDTAREEERKQEQLRQIAEQQRLEQETQKQPSQPPVQKTLRSRRTPSINQVAIMGQITDIKYKPGRIFCWIIDIAVFNEYGGNEHSEVDAYVTCGAAEGGHAEEIASAKVGDWATVQGKLRNNGFVQIRSLSIISVS